MNNVLLEKDLYPYMCVWLQQRLEDRFKNENCSIIVEDVSTINLDTALNTYGVLEYYPNIVGLGIQIDVLGIVKWQHKASLFFIEAKKTHLPRFYVSTSKSIIKALINMRSFEIQLSPIG